MNGVKYFQLGAWEPFLNELGVKDDRELYEVLGFGDMLGFMERSRWYSENGEGGRFAEAAGGLVLIEVMLMERWVKSWGPWREYERALTAFRIVVTKEFFEEAGGNPIAAARRAKVVLRDIRRTQDPSP